MEDIPLGQPSRETKEEANRRCNAIRSKYGAVERQKKENISDLPRWVRMALVEYVTLGNTLAEVAEKYGKSTSSMYKYAASPAGKKWRAEIQKVADDPERLAMSTIRANAANVTLEYLMALQSAIDAGDYREIGVMSRDILDRLGITKQTKQSASAAAAKQTIVIQLGSGVSLDTPTVETSYQERVEEADWEVEDAS